jgi:hypothetical protein
MGHLLVDVYLFSFGSQFTLLHGEWMLPQTEYFVKWRQQMPIARVVRLSKNINIVVLCNAGRLKII